jgi:hypothetical protein
LDIRRSGRREVALRRAVRPLEVVDPPDQLGDHEIQIGIALTVRMRRHVHRHPRQVRLEISAVVEVEAAHEVLIRFAAPECWVMIIPGMYSMTSPGRRSGRSSMSSGATCPELAAFEVPRPLS